MSKRKYGDQRACTRCGQDVEWHGRAHGWLDRGCNTDCPPYKGPNHEIIVPKDKKHTVPRDE